MLVDFDQAQRSYTICLNNASDGAEVFADLSYLAEAPSGVLTFDFTHMAASLTLEQREDYLPGNLGYQPARQLIEVIAAIATCAADHGTYPHHIEAILPDPRTRVGDFLVRMETPEILKHFGVMFSFDQPTNAELGRDDMTRQNLIPLANIAVSSDGHPDFTQLRSIRTQVERVFGRALPNAVDLVECFTRVVAEAVDNAVEYGAGGIIGGLYYPRAGEVEISLVNRAGGFGGVSPTEELDALISACEGRSKRVNGGGNGIAELTHLAAACFGTLVLRNGGATLYLQPDGSVTARVDEYGLPTPGAAVTVLLQLLPADAPVPTDTLTAYTEVLQASLAVYSKRR